MKVKILHLYVKHWVQDILNLVVKCTRMNPGGTNLRQLVPSCRDNYFVHWKESHVIVLVQFQDDQISIPLLRSIVCDRHFRRLGHFQGIKLEIGAGT